jgi:hypothetical protein
MISEGTKKKAEPSTILPLLLASPDAIVLSDANPCFAVVGVPQVQDARTAEKPR